MDIQKVKMSRNSRLLNVIATDLNENEALVRRLAQEEQARNPRDFAGKAPCVFFKLPYVPPYEQFKLLRQLILRVRQNTGLRSEYRGIVALDVTEWLGHESEEYFTVLLKFLYDHSHSWNSVMLLSNPTEQQRLRFTQTCAQLITPRLQDVTLFNDEQLLTQLLEEQVHSHGCITSRTAITALAQAMTQLPKQHRSLPLIERVAEDLIANTDADLRISMNHVNQYLCCRTSLLSILAGKPLMEERSKTDEKKAV